MNTKPTLARGLAFITLAATLFALGCQTSGYRRATRTADTMSSAANDLQNAQEQIQMATNALDQVVNRPTEDLRPAFEDYRGSVASLENTASQLQARADEMARRREAYLAEWDQRNEQIQNPEIRDQSLERQREVTEQFAEVQQGYTEAHQSLMPLLSDLRDIQRLLGIDLTAAGVQNARNLYSSVEQNAQQARETLSRVTEQFRDASATLDPETISAISE